MLTQNTISKKNKKYVTICIVLLFFVGFVGYQLFLESPIFQIASNLIKHSIYFTLIITVYTIGRFAWQIINSKWILILWNIVYLISFVIFLVAAILHIFNERLQDHLILAIVNFRIFMLSPLPFCSLYILHKINKILCANES